MPQRDQKRVLAIILAGGRGRRLMPLTEERCKPAVPFAVNHRIIDFALSNVVNSGILNVHLLVQYRSDSLIDHLQRAWRVDRPGDGFVTIVPPPMKAKGIPYQGTADAVYQNMGRIAVFPRRLWRSSPPTTSTGWMFSK